MNFKIFDLDLDLDKRLCRYGYAIDSYKRILIYTSDGNIESKMVPDKYKYKDSVWCESSLLPCYERLFCLMKLPEPNYDELWNIYINSPKSDDEVGSISIIIDKYSDKLLETINNLCCRDAVVASRKGKLKRLAHYLECSDSTLKDMITKTLANLI